MRGPKKIVLLFFAIALTNASVNSSDGQCYDARFDDEIAYFDEDPVSSVLGGIVEAIAGPLQSLQGLLAIVTGIIAKANVDPLEVFRDSYPLPEGYSEPLNEYDYIIVGAGSAGSALAARLTEDKEAMVLVLEAGKSESLSTELPILTSLWADSDYAFQYQAEPQPGICSGSDDGLCYWPRGKAVGGSSVCNFMIYTRGRPEDWDRIAADGNYGWSYKEVLEYYIKSEKADLKRLPKDPPYHGRNGPLNVEHVSFRTALAEAFLEAGRQLGIPTVDYNSPDEFGFGYIQTTTHYGHRVSAAKAYLHPHRSRRNLHILPSTTVAKVNIDPKTKRAYGVNYIKNGKTYTVRARKEVILSAGPIGSPQLLMLSGVGPKEHLESHGIPVIKDLPVGRTLYDHVTFPGVTFKLNTTNVSIRLKKVVNPQNLVQWLTFGDGVFSSIGTVEGLGYIKTSESEDPELVPDIELLALAGSMALDSGAFFRKAWKISDKTYKTVYGPLENIDSFMTVPMLLHPRSKGYLELKDTNPFSHPRLYANYFSDPHDLATMRAAVKFIIKLTGTDPYKKYGTELHLAEYEECKNEVPGSDDYWDCAIKTLLITLYHQIATCKMGPASDPTAVVDPELRVYGIEGLRVVDSGVIPRPTAAHTNAPAIMIGEKAADMIKKTWESKC